MRMNASDDLHALNAAVAGQAALKITTCLPLNLWHSGRSPPNFQGKAMADTTLVLCIVLSAYFIRGITGFGSGLIAVPLLALSHPLTFAVPLVLALDFT